MNQILEILYNNADTCPLTKCAIRQSGRYGQAFMNDGLNACLLADDLVNHYEGTYSDLKRQLLALCPRKGSLVPLMAELYLDKRADADMLEAVMDACVRKEVAAANAGCRSFASCFGTPARAKRTVMGMVYDAVLKEVLYSDMYMGLSDSYTQGDLWDAAVHGFDRGWKFDAAMDGYYRIYSDVLEMIVHPEAGPNAPFPGEDLSDINSLVIYGVAHPDAMRNTVKGVLERTTALRHFAALNVASCDTSFEVFADVELPHLSTVVIDVTETWGELLPVEDEQLETDQVAYPWRMANSMKESLERPDERGPILIFRHDVDHGGVTSNPITWIESEDKYLPCPGAIFFTEEAA